MTIIEKIIRHHLLQSSTDESTQRLEERISIAASEIEWHLYRTSPWKDTQAQTEREYRRLDRRFSDLENELTEIRKALNSNRNGGPVCRFRGDDAPEGILHLITQGGPSLIADYSGKREMDRSLSNWLKESVEVICIDPYLFKRSQSGTEDPAETLRKDNEYADQLLAVLGKKKQVQFIYRSERGQGKSALKVSPNVADRIEAKIPALGIQATFRAVEDLHDRVWLMRDKKNNWHAKVVGTSRDGIGKRPTYLVDMTAEDCREYRPYVDFLIANSEVSHERPVNFRGQSKTARSPVN